MKYQIAMILITVCLVIGLFNFTPIPILLGIKPVIHVYNYENSKGEEISEYPEKGTPMNFDEPGLKRKFKKNYLHFWYWRSYMTHPRWNVPYYSGN